MSSQTTRYHAVQALSHTHAKCNRSGKESRRWSARYQTQFGGVMRLGAQVLKNNKVEISTLTTVITLKQTPTLNQAASGESPEAFWT